MTPTQAIESFGGRKALAVALGVSETAIHLWAKQGWIPYDRQCQIQVEAERLPAPATVKASWDDMPEDRRRVAA